MSRQRPAPPDDAEPGVLDLISKIKSGATAPQNINAQTRQCCVEYLHAEGVSVPEIAKLMGYTDRTIRRDLVAIRAENTLHQDPEFAGQIAGELLVETRRAMEQLARLLRDKAATPTDRIAASKARVELLERAIARLQSLGYLPTATHRIAATFGAEEIEDLAPGQILCELQRLNAVVSDCSSGDLAALPTGQLNGPANNGDAGHGNAGPSTDGLYAPCDRTSKGGAP